jgi:microcystin-dependent protein
MPTTTNRGYSVPTTGTQSGIWGSDDLNPNFTSIDKNLGAVASVSLSSSNVSLSSSEYVCGTIKFSGTLSANVTVTFPTVAGWWTIINNCTGSFYIRLSCSSGGLKICPPPGEAIDVGFDGTDAFYRNLPQQIGDYKDYAGSSVPLWISGCSVPPYLLCDGSTFSAVTYPYLNTVLGTTTLPSSLGRLRATLNGGTSRITTAGSGIDGDTRFSKGGAQNVTLTEAQLPPVTKSVPAQRPTFTYGTSTTGVQSASPPPFGVIGVTIAGSGAGSSVTTVGDVAPGSITFGSGDFHNNMPPTYIGGITMIRAA